MKNSKILFFVLLVVLLLPNLVLSFTEILSPMGRLTMCVLPLSLYWLLMTLYRKPGVVAWCAFPLLFLGAFQLVLSYLFGQGVIAVDMWLNLVTTNTGEVNELLSQLLPSIVMVVVIYIPLLVYATYSWLKGTELSQAFLLRNRKWGGSLFVVGLMLLLGCYSEGKYQIKNDLFPFNACYNCYLAFERNAMSRNYVEASRDFRFNARSVHPDTLSEVVVCVIGETSRALNWSLYGYKRPTNPILAGIEGLTVFRDALSQSNTTHKSVPILLSLASAENYDILYKTKGILAAYHEAGFYTCFFSNQQRNHSYIDFLGEQADECVFVKEMQGEHTNDTALLVFLERAMKEHSGKLFVVLHTYGSHFNYNDRYSPENVAFSPDKIPGAAKRYRRELINAYDNTIRATDDFLGRIVGLLDGGERIASMLYTSDHGEDIFDDVRERFLHASPQPTYYQLHVPLLVWTSLGYRETFPENQALLVARQHTPVGSDCVFHTLLGLGGIETPYRNDSLSLVSPSFKAKERHYINDYNQPIKLPDCLGKLDLEILKRNQQRYE